MTEPAEDYSVYTVALQLDSSALQQALRTKSYDEAKRIEARMMGCLHKLNIYTTQQQADKARKDSEPQGV
jgi:hypothetical protein